MQRSGYVTFVGRAYRVCAWFFFIKKNNVYILICVFGKITIQKAGFFVVAYEKWNKIMTKDWNHEKSVFQTRIV